MFVFVVCFLGARSFAQCSLQNKIIFSPEYFILSHVKSLYELYKNRANLPENCSLPNFVKYIVKIVIAAYKEK